jgi:hypothetical protein
MEDYFKTAVAEDVLSHSKSKRDPTDWIQAVQIEDLRVGRVLEVYTIGRISLEAYPDTVPFSEIIQPTGLLRVLIMAHDKPLYEMTLFNTIRGLKEPRIFGYDKDIWDPLLESYPELTGINPVLVTTDDAFSGLTDMGDHFLYFKQKGPRRVHYIKREGALRNVELETLFSGSIRTLDDSRKFVRHKKRGGK